MTERDDEVSSKDGHGSYFLLSNDIDQSGEVTYESSQLVQIPELPHRGFSLRKLLAFMGPGFLMSVAYIDPGNLESDVIAGGKARYSLLFALLLSTLGGYVLQLLAARLGVVTGMHLAQVCREKYPKWPRLFLWLLMELAIIGADIQEVFGSAVALNLLSYGRIPLFAGAIITGVDTFTILFLEKFGIRKLEAVIITLIMTLLVCLGYMYGYSHPNQVDVLKGLFYPNVTSSAKSLPLTALGIVGAVIMPHNIYLHSALVLSRNIDREKNQAVREGILYNSIDSGIALFFSFLINLFVISIFGQYMFGRDLNMLSSGCYLRFSYNESLNCSIQLNGAKWYCNGLHNCGSPSHIPHVFPILWGVGLLAAGQASTMMGTYAGQFIMDGFLNIKWSRWKRVLLTRSVALVPVILITTISTALEQFPKLDDAVNIQQSLLLPFALFPVLHMTNSRRVMGNYRLSKFLLVAAWIVALVSMGSCLGLIIYSVVTSQSKNREAWRIVTGIGLPIYALILCYYLFSPGTIQRMKESIRWKLWRRKMWKDPLATTSSDKTRKLLSEKGEKEEDSANSDKII